MNYMAALKEILDILDKLATNTCRFPRDAQKLVDAYNSIIKECELSRKGWIALAKRQKEAK